MNMLQLEKHLFEIAETIPHKYIAEQFEPIIYANVYAEWEKEQSEYKSDYTEPMDDIEI